ncbi:MAG: hypothetical protein NWF08_04585 [Candidatus Bathyarchaeota archaeon]|nr:hypothetical protein [Candidatus Bathyarchaeota archaeon]
MIFNRKRFFLVLFSFIIQCILGLFLGHQYDMGIFLTSGYIVANGNAPYGLFSTSPIFDHQGFFEILPGLGYPPPWGLFLGLVYLIVYKSTSNIFVYNLAVKIPGILANIGLAFIMEKIANQEGIDKINSNRIFHFFLFNPYFIYISAVWGQFDSVVIMLVILAIDYLLYCKWIKSSLLIALATSLKIIPLLLFPMYLIFLKRNHESSSSIKFFLTFVVAFISLSYLPFRIFDWDLNIIISNLDFHFIRAGCFTFFNIFDLLSGMEKLPPELEFLGYLWIPALVFLYYGLSKTKLENRIDLFRWASSIIFITILTRSWVSEQNIILLIPLIILPTLVYDKNWKIISLAWILPSIFSIINTSPFQMFFLISSRPLTFIRELDRIVKFPRLLLKFLIMIPWQVLGWTYIIKLVKDSKKYAK